MNKKSNKYRKNKAKNKSRRNKRKKQIMFSATTKEEPKKILRTYVIKPKLYEQFKYVANKDGRKFSNIIERSIVRYINSKIQRKRK